MLLDSIALQITHDMLLDSTALQITHDNLFKTQAMKQLLRENERGDPKGWAEAQHYIQTAKLQRTRLTREIEDLKSTILQADVEASRGM